MKKNVIYENIDVASVFVLMLSVFSYIMFSPSIDSDLPLHVSLAERVLEEQKLFDRNFLLYLVIHILTLFSGNQLAISCALVLLIAFANTAKYIIVRTAFSSFASKHIARISSFALLFVYIFPLGYLKFFGLFQNSGYMYLGYEVPNLWHNSTYLTMMPFAILTYLYAVEQFDKYSDKRNLLITLFTSIGILIKPSFFFIFSIAYLAVILFKYGFKTEFYKSLIPISVGIVLCIYIALCVFIYKSEGSDGGLMIDISQIFSLSFWKAKFLRLAVSLFFPIIFTIVYVKTCYRDLEFYFCLLMLVVALGIKWCCYETGSRAMDGNFGWQVMCAMWFVYYYMLKVIVKEFVTVKQKNTRKPIFRYFVLSLYSLSVMSGIYYLIHFLYSGYYY